MSTDTLVADLDWDHLSVVVASDDVRATIEAALGSIDSERTPDLVPITLANHDGAEHPSPVLVKAGSVFLLALDPYESARVEWARYGSDIGSRNGDD